jgi:hypothetical protein
MARPPLFRRAMTAAQRQRRRRKKLAEEKKATRAAARERWRQSEAPPPSAQPATGIQQDADFRPPLPRGGIIERFVGWWNGHPVYRERPPKVTWLRDPRAVRNEKLTAERRARGEVGTLESLDDGPGPYRWDGRGEP